MIRFSVPCQIVLVQHFVWKTKNESYFLEKCCDWVWGLGWEANLKKIQSLGFDWEGWVRAGGGEGGKAHKGLFKTIPTQSQSPNSTARTSILNSSY